MLNILAQFARCGVSEKPGQGHAEKNKSRVGVRRAALQPASRAWDHAGQLAELIGSSQRAISAYETVAEYPPTAVVVEMASALKVSADELLGLRTPRATKAKQDPETRNLWKKFQQIKRLPEMDQRAVIRLVNSLVAVNGR